MPPAVANLAEDAIFLAGAYGLVPDPWQEEILYGWMGLRADRKWAASRVGTAVARQNGKNSALEVRELFGMVDLGERFLHTAHEVKTARKAFVRLLDFFDNLRFPELRDMVKEIRRTNGQEAILLTNGGGVEFVARTKGSGRGFTVDVLVLDEAQELSDETYAALLPTISSAPLGNPQQILTGTPPGPKNNGEVFERTRSKALTDDPGRLAWLEWSCEKGADLDDRDLWAAANPALGLRPNAIQLEAIIDERAAMDDDEFGRERLGIWNEPDAHGGRWREFDEAEWRACRAGGPLEHPQAWAVDVDENADGKVWTSIACAEPGAFDLVEVGEGTGWVVRELKALSDSHRFTEVALNPDGLVGQLRPAIEEAGLEVVDVSGRKFSAATELVLTSVRDRAVRYPEHDGKGGRALDAAAAGAVTRDSGDGASAWSRKASAADIGPLVAATCALWHAQQGDSVYEDEGLMVL